jgi:delta8-fatty-acid desaturase
MMASPHNSLPILSPEEVKEFIAEGRIIVIVGKDVLKLDLWLRFHPGGDKSILHMVGRDATDEVNA